MTRRRRRKINSGGAGGAYTPSLDFSDERNSQYLATSA